jgi:hypothetical protein
MQIHKAIVAIVFLAIAGCGKPNKFEQHFTKPAWFDSLEAPEINTPEEVDALWQSEKRCCEDANTLLKNNRIFYKSCFNAISKNYDNEELVVTCLWLMDVGAESNQRIEISRFLVDNFRHHKNSVNNCANCMPGDTVARVTLDLARYESRTSNSKDQPINRIENLLDSRKDEISYWVQAEIYEFLGETYLEAGINYERLNRFKEAYNKLDKIKNYNEPLERRFAPLVKLYNLILQNAPNDSAKL